ncbi:MAG: Protein transport protein Sec24B [Icmadophila ericetorum]|nr:Protein transport protein Sec24B [Icmadophila ericetorum]
MPDFPWNRKKSGDMGSSLIPRLTNAFAQVSRALDPQPLPQTPYFGAYNPPQMQYPHSYGYHPAQTLQPHYYRPPPTPQPAVYQPALYHPSNWQQPQTTPSSSTLVPYRDSSIARPNSALGSPMPYSPPPTSTAVSPTVLPGRSTSSVGPHVAPEVTRISTSATTTQSLVTPPPSQTSPGLLELPQPSVWSQPGIGRIPFSAAVPQRKPGPVEPPRIRKILSLGKLKDDEQSRSIRLTLS